MIPQGAAVCRRRRQLLLWTCGYGALLLTFSGASQAQPIYSRNLFGSPGIVDMPSARMAPDGELSAGASFFQNTQHYNLGFQALPWLETSFRYSGLSHFNPDYPVYYDRSFGFKARLWNEGDVLPTVAIGVDDVVGTGVYSGEFIVASKQIGPVDATIGLGWGRLGTANTFRNPLGVLSDSFYRTRSLDTPGSANFGDLFHGPTTGIFAGAVWRTPVEGLLVSAEYSSDAFATEKGTGNFKPRSQLNFGAAYQWGNTTLGLQWLYGQSLGGSLSFQIDPVANNQMTRVGPVPPPFHTRSPEEQAHAQFVLRRGGMRDSHAASNTTGAFIDALVTQGANPQTIAFTGRTLTLSAGQNNAAALCSTAAQMAANYHIGLDYITVHGPATQQCTVQQSAAPSVTFLTLPAVATKATGPVVIDARGSKDSLVASIAAIRRDLATQGITVGAIDITNGLATVYYGNSLYYREDNALDRVVRVLLTDAPVDVEEFRLIPTVNDIAQRQFNILRSSTERSIAQSDSYSFDFDGNHAVEAPVSNPILQRAQRGTFPQFSWTVFPQLRQELFDPSNPMAVQILVGAAASLELFSGFRITGEGELNIYDNFNTLRPSDSVLPHVRTDFISYFTKGKNGIGQLDADYRFKLSDDVFGIVKAGYLESMFAGVGGEVLWRPEGQRWALSADLYGLKQRDFDRLLSLQNYHVITGHVSLYYASPWYGLDFMVRAGRYLAGDEGVTFRASRRFSTGVEVGAFFTKTNVSAQRFGEGSFDKGIFFRMPLGWIIPINTQTEYSIELRPVQRDGGQNLLGDAPLYEETRRSSETEMSLVSAGSSTQ